MTNPSSRNNRPKHRNRSPATAKKLGQLHPRNPHQGRYDFGLLTRALPELADYTITNPKGEPTINFSDAKADGRETVEGVTTVRITGMVSADAVNKIAPQIAATAPVPGTAWVAEDGDHQLMQARLEPSPGNSVTMTLSDWGEPVTVDKPAV